MKTVTRQKQRILLWIAALLCATGLAGAPALVGTAAADCTIACVGTTGNSGCEESLLDEGSPIEVCLGDTTP